MNAVVFERMPVAELPEAWREKLAKAVGALVTVRIEQGPQATHAQAEDFADDPLFGMWRDREDMADVAGYVRRLLVAKLPAVQAKARRNQAGGARR